ncbi:MAG: glycosyl transferase family 2 [Sphingopyxis sp.]|nr:MAG: glycosyl transferase family 2 [Sphingopyxis sp.]
MSKKIHFVIIDFFKAERVIDVVKSINNQNYDNHKIFISVIDNSCSEGNYRTLEKGLTGLASLIKSTDNIGYTKAANKAVSECEWEADIICLLNPDIIFEDVNTLNFMMDNFDDPKCLIVGPAQSNDDGSEPDIVRNYPSALALVLKRSPFRKAPVAARIVDSYLLPNFDSSKRQNAPWLQSSCIFIQKSFWDSIGGLNTKYFLFMSDIEICKKAYEKGGYVLYDPAVRVIADGKRCSEGGISSLFKSPAMRHHVKDAIKYYLGGS